MNKLDKTFSAGQPLHASELNEIVTTLNESVDEVNKVEGAIPSAAYVSGNELADKNFVNSSIGTATATFRGTYEALSDTEQAAQTALSAIMEMDANDYAFVQVQDTPVTGVDKFKRYKYTGTQWQYEYTLNNSSFTSDQWAAINSGMTSAEKTKLDGIASGAQVNVIETVKVNGTSLTPDANKAVDILTGLDVVEFSGASLSCDVDKYYRATVSVGTLAVTLPAISGAKEKVIMLHFTTGSTPAVTFTSTDSKNISYAQDYELDASTEYELEVRYNGSKWIVEYEIIGGSSSLTTAEIDSIWNSATA